MRAIVRSPAPVTLLGGAPASSAQLVEALRLAPTLVAADGGADTALALGLTPAAVIGDMDSLSPEAAGAFAAVLHRIDEQETTDFDKALTRIDAPALLALGFAGGRIDHELAALHSLCLRVDRPCLLLGPETLAFHAPPELRLDLPAGTLVSLFPLTDLRVASEGLLWPTDHLLLGPLRRIGTSNAARGGPLRLRPSAPGLLVILPPAAVGPALDALRAAPRWPAPPPA
ncbi:thiamine diphosphokinase [Rubellimicrobium aerolatum]|uniref:Thiamine diphosphokinase n=1 Tax=Rubellimicrobium aerolatum TaxID=490979 RepID=A0ABW0SDH6_9RHOB|nr:thiamine diphosphokinase [Rubellimicrobium aerolatum]MBP1805776.1 thiamine pyrophosphokinase [Rubellimicrobium aerolatum]